MRIGSAALAALLAAAAGAQAETYDLEIHAYCATAATFCGFGTYSNYWTYIHDVVHEINVQWEAVGISFRPASVPAPINDPTYVDAQCTNLTGTPVDEAAVFDLWRQNVAAASPGSISILLIQDTMGNGCCSQLPNVPNNIAAERFGLLCDLQRPAYDLGSVLAHELGHHFCLCHTFQLAAASGSPVDLEEWSVFTDGPLDWDGDDASCPQGLLGTAETVLDTDPDPRQFEQYDSKLPATAPDENAASVPRDDHEWCDAQVNLNVDQGSTHATSCLTACIQQVAGQPVGWVPPGTVAERAALAMSYWDDFGRCHGPWTVGGALFNAFTPDSVTRILACRDTYRTTGTLNPLTEVCGARGGDSDSDGICDFDDNCVFVKNTTQLDTDGDGQGNGCDLSAEDPDPQVDIDDDLIGGLADQDSDGDGCPNVEDQHPLESHPVTGSVLYVGCGSGSVAVYTFEGKNSDTDTWLNCEDLDDDDDRVCDEGGPYSYGDPGVPAGGCEAGPGGIDPCPTDPADDCHVEVPFPDCAPPWVVCAGPGCEPFVLKLVPVGDPDTAPLTIDSFQILNETLFLAPIAGRTLSRTALALQGDFESLAVPTATGLAMAEQLVGTLSLEIWSRDPEQFVAQVAEYPSDGATFGDTSRGLFLAVAPGGAGLEGAAVFARGQDPLDPPPRDQDGDGWPDFYDNCPYDPNPRQIDADGDRFGNACDPDIDGDFLVTQPDVDWVEGCEGADLTLTAPLAEPEWLGGDPRPVPDPAAYALAVRCPAADLNDDAAVDAGDSLLAAARLGLPPGPSAFRGNTSPCAAPGACDDGDPCTVDRCVHSTGECLHLTVACDDLDRCTVDSCDPLTGACNHAPLVCDDGNACTADSCDPADGSCVFDSASRDGEACDDLSACTDRDTCLDGACEGNPSIACDDGDPCTLDGCDPASGACVVVGDACDDGNGCTIDTCGRTGCQHVPLGDGAPCEDGSLCTTDDFCLAAVCQPGGAIPCDDGDACTVDACDPPTGQCLAAPLSCDDGDACTADSCADGRCSNVPLELAPVDGVRFENGRRLAWNVSAGAMHWNTYRGTIPPGGLGSRPQAYDQSCFESADLGGDGAAASTDFGTPVRGAAFYYLVSPEDLCGEGILGPGPGGLPRPNDQPCLTPP